MIYLGADHAGFKLKEKIKIFLDSEKIKYTDLGAFNYDKLDDYPDYAKKVCKKLLKEKNSKGILICGTGQGMCIAANKFKGIIASPVFNVETAEHAKKDNNARIICLGSKFVDEELARKIIKKWLKTKFGRGRHLRRLNKIKRLK